MIPDCAKGQVMRAWALTLMWALLIVLLPAAAHAIDRPDWAFPVADKVQPPSPDDSQPKTVTGSTKSYTQKQIDDLKNPPDWFPEDHPPMPEIVAHGGPKPAGRACAMCHLTSGDGHPESAGLSGLQATYTVRQMAAFKNGERTGQRAPVMIAMANPFDALGKEAVQQLLDYNVQWHLCSPQAMAKVLGDTFRIEK